MYSYEETIGYSKIGNEGYVPDYEILDIFQDCNSFQTRSIGAGGDYMDSLGKAWVIVSYRIVLYNQIKEGDMVQVKTAPYNFERIYAHRANGIADKDGNYLVKADCLWIVIDQNTRRPSRIDDEITRPYLECEGEGFDDVKATRKLHFDGDFKEMPSFKVLTTYIDSNNHMNNAAYLRLAHEVLPEGFIPKVIDVVYEKEALKGDTIIPRLYENEDYIGLEYVGDSGDIFAKIRYSKRYDI